MSERPAVYGSRSLRDDKDASGETWCGFCGTKLPYVRARTIRAVQPPDLDWRPGGPPRNDFRKRMMRCPVCGYAGQDISECDLEDCVPVITSTRYRSMLVDPAYPELARTFLCSAMLNGEAGYLLAAALDALHAAWVCDDAEMTEAARQCRIRAAGLLEQIKLEEPVVDPGCEDDSFLGYLLRGMWEFPKDDPEADRQARELAANHDLALLRIDILRRAGWFRDAMRACREYYLAGAGGRNLLVLRYEEKLIRARDQDAHTIVDALGPDCDWKTWGADQHFEFPPLEFCSGQ